MMENWPEDLRRALDEAIRLSDSRGLISHAQLSEAMPARDVSAQEIEDMIEALENMGIEIVDASTV